MKKNWNKLFAILLALSLMVSLAACGTQKTPAPTDNESKTETPTSGESNADKPKLKAVMITPQKLGDNGPIDASYAGLKKGEKDFGYEVKLLEPAPGEYEDAMRAMADEGYNLIFGLFTATQDAILRVAPDYPDVNFVMILGEVDLPNVKSLNYKEQEGSYLNGIVAAYMTKTGKIGAILGAEVPDNIRCASGFFAGAKEINPNIETSVLYVGSFEDPVKGKALANVMLGEGYDVIYELCATSSMGIREAIKEKGGATYMVGNVVDESSAVPGQVPCSNFTSYEMLFYSSMKELAEGKFKSGSYNLGLADGAVDIIYAPDNLLKIPQEIKDKVAAYREKIIKGEIVPPSTFSK